jgi:putative serine dehydratase-like protein
MLRPMRSPPTSTAVAVSSATNRLRIDYKIRFMPGHCDPTVNLHDWYVGIRGNRVQQLWPITAPRRGLLKSFTSGPYRRGHCNEPSRSSAMKVTLTSSADCRV